MKDPSSAAQKFENLEKIDETKNIGLGLVGS